VLPGSVWDGRRYTRGHAPIPTTGLEPVGPSVCGGRNGRLVWSWWGRAPYSVLTRSGQQFDVITAPTCLPIFATGWQQFPGDLCPVLESPRGMRLFIRRGARLHQDLARVRGLELAAPGTLIPLPPTRLPAGLVTWRIPPASVGWTPGNPEAVQEALATVFADYLGGCDDS
jgi:hypothetical protein